MRNKNNYRELKNALISKNFEDIEKLLKAGAKLKTQLFRSLSKFNEEKVEKLFCLISNSNNNNLELNKAKTNNGNTILHLAASLGNEVTVLHFINKAGKVGIDIPNSIIKLPCIYWKYRSFIGAY